MKRSSLRQLIELKDAVSLHFIEAVLAEVILERLPGLLGKLLEVFVYRVPVHALALGFERAGLGLIILHAFLVILDGAVDIINFGVIKPPNTFVLLHPGVTNVLLLLEGVESIGAEHTLVFLVACVIQCLDLRRIIRG